MSFLSGICYTRFWDRHRRHHKLGNHAPLMPPKNLELYSEDARGHGTRVWMTRGSVLIIAVLQKFQAFAYLWANRRSTRGDQLALALHYTLWLAMPALLIGASDAAINYLLITLFIGPYASVLYFITHEGMSVIDAESPPPYLLRHLLSTRDLGRGWVNSIMLGGVNHHVAHHLFPGIPRRQLSKARRIVRSFCRSNNLPYVETSSLKGLKALIFALCSGHQDRTLRDQQVTTK